MFQALTVTHSGPTTLVATQRRPQPFTVTLHCGQGLPAGTDVRVSMSSRHAYDQGWQLDGIRVKGGEGRLVMGHDLPRDWTEQSRGGVSPAGGGLVGRPVGEVYLITVQVTEALSPGASMAFFFQVTGCTHAAVAGALLVKVRDADAESFVLVGEPIYFSATLHGTGRIDLVEIISQGHTVWRDRPNTWDAKYDAVPLPAPQGLSTYYYLRLRQADGHRAWLSPVWLTQVLT